MTDDANRLLFAQEHDEANALEWWHAHDDAARLAVWAMIQKEADSPMGEVVLRFAQLGFTHVALLAAQEKVDGRSTLERLPDTDD